MDNEFSIVDASGNVLTDPESRAMTFRGPNAWSIARAASFPRYKSRKLIAGCTVPGKPQEPYRGQVYIEATTPLEPSGESKWEVTPDGSTYPVDPETNKRLADK